MTIQTGNNMHNETPWTITAMLIGFYNMLISHFASLSLNDWVLVIGALGGIASLIIAIFRYIQESEIRKLDVAIRRAQLKKLQQNQHNG
jgi:NADPH:quinone reductase-like Zn-dependent oxidoreductase